MLKMSTSEKPLEATLLPTEVEHQAPVITDLKIYKTLPNNYSKNN